MVSDNTTRLTEAALVIVSILGAIFLLEKRGAGREIVDNEQNANSHKRNASANESTETSSADKTPDKWHPQEREHRKKESVYWRNQNIISNITMFITLVAVAGTIASSYFSSQALTQASRAADAATDAANQARRQADAAVTDQRPWVSLNVQVAGPLEYDGKIWRMPLRWQARNIGKTPALNVDFFAELLPFTIAHWPLEQFKNGVPQGMPIAGTDVPSEFNNTCGFMAHFDSGQILFPGEDRQDAFGLGGNPAIFDAAKATASGYGGNFIVITCIHYRFSEDTKMEGATAKAFQLFKRSGDARINLTGESITESELGFAPHPENGSYAK